MILIKNALIVTQNPQRQIIKDGAVLIDGGKIKEIGESETVARKYLNEFSGNAADSKIIYGTGKVVIPGLINMHTHAAMTLFRGYADDMPLKNWLEEKIWPAEEKLKPEDIYSGSILALSEMLLSGTTCFNDMYWNPEMTLQVAEEKGMRCFIGGGLLDLLAKGLKENAEKFIKTVKNFNSRSSLVNLTIAPHSVYSVSEKNLIWARDFAKENDLSVHMHVSETKKEADDFFAKNNLRPVEYLNKIGLLGRKTILAHCIWVDKKEIEILAETGTSVVHCPSSNMKLASGIMPLTELLDAGVNVSLGTDGACSNNGLDMLSEMKIAALLHKINKMDPTVIKAEQVLDMATINGAKALGLEKEIGSVEVGKKADLAILDFRQPHLMPLQDNVISHLVYVANGGDVETVIIDGKIVMENRILKTKDGSN